MIKAKEESENEEGPRSLNSFLRGVLLHITCMASVLTELCIDRNIQFKCYELVNFVRHFVTPDSEKLKYRYKCLLFAKIQILTVFRSFC